MKKKLKKGWPLYLMLLPGIVLTFIFSYIPLYGLVIAFQDYNPGLGFSSPWIGLKNFEFVFTQPNFIRTIWNTLYMSVLKILGNIAVPVIFALLLNEISNRFLKRVFQTLIYIPNFMSWVILAGIMMNLLGSNGPVNQLLSAMHIPTVNFLGDANVFPWTMIVTAIWQSFGFGTIIYLAALTSIDPELYDSARVDGAKRMKQLRYITLPLLMPTVILMLVLSLGGILNAGFDQIFNLYSPVVYSSGDIIDTYVYRLGINQAQYSVATAVGLFKSLVSCILVVLSYVLADKVANYRVL